MTCPVTGMFDRAMGLLDPMLMIERAALQGNGLARIPLPGKRSYWVVSEPELLDHILVKEAKNFDKSGPVYDVLSQRRLPGDTGGILDGGMFTQNNHVLWRLLRDICNPYFQTTALDEATLHAIDLTRDKLLDWKSGREVQLLPMFKDISMGVLTHHLFGGQIDPATTASISSAAVQYFEKMAWQLVFGLLPTRQLTGWNAYDSIGRELGNLLDQIIHEAQSDQDRFRNTILGRLLAAFDVDTPRGRQLVKGSIGTFFLAGVDSTAVVQSWAGMELAQDTVLQTQLRQEVRQSTGRGPIRVEHLAQMEQLAAFWELMLHKHTAFRVIFRNVRDDCQLGEQRVKADDQLLLALHAAHQDPRYWQDDRNLTVEHFLGGLTPEEREAHLPFGRGSKQCIGAPLANRVGLSTLAVILDGWELGTARRPSTRRSVGMTSPPLRSAVRVSSFA